MTAPEALRLDVLVDAEHLEKTLREEVRVGLTSSPKELPPKWFYDERGSLLFDDITRLPQYYLTRAETQILERVAPEIARITAVDTLVELGSGTSTKTRLLLDALNDAGQLARFIPFDVSREVLETAATQIALRYEGIDVHGVVGDFDHHLAHLPQEGRRLVIFLGSTIGNLDPGMRKAFLTDIAAGLQPGDAFLLGADLVKDVARLEAAYNDPAGVTAAFNLNVLNVLNKHLHADLDPAGFAHVARWDPDEEWIEMLLRSTEDQVAQVTDLGLRVSFSEGEEMRTEISCKFRRAGLEAELNAVGLRVARWWTDDAGDFALLLALP